MPTIANGGNATGSAVYADSVSIQGTAGSICKFESPTGTEIAQFTGSRVFGPYNNQTFKITSIFGPIYYEVIDAFPTGTTIPGVAVVDASGAITGLVKPDGSTQALGSGGGGTWGSITGTLSSQTDLNTALGTKAPGGTTVALAATTLTLTAATHNGNVIAANNASPIAITVNTGLGTGFSCVIMQTGAGIVTVSGTATLNGTPALSTSGIGTSLTLVQTATDTYTVLSPVNGVTVNNQTGTTYTLVASDAGAYITMNNASANTLTIPANASVAFPIGTVITVEQLGAGATTIAITTDTLLKPSARSLTISAQYETAVLTKTAATTWKCIAA